ncbi:MAG: hypothetical protein HQL35_14215 [Alphaproteobacteria bacterium]|nr:hypothetical protein [Alphaproteobacteria bacterium]
MKVKELMELLAGQPPERRVVLDGFEGGYHDANAAGEIPLVLNVHDVWYYGAHEHAPYGEQEADETAFFIGVKPGINR